MLVLSRRPSETIVFPAINTTIHLVKVKGNLAKIGIEAPKNLQIVRGELAADGTQWIDAQGDLGEDLFQQNHAMRNRLNVASVGFSLVHRLLEQGRIEDAQETLKRVIQRFAGTDGEREPEEAAQAAAPRALLVEDDDNERHLLAGLLRTHGFEVETADNGAEALEQLARDLLPDIVLMDMMMPECDGPTAVREIRSNPKHQGLTIFAVSAASPTSLGLTTGPQGIDRWFPKPLDPETLVGEMARKVGVLS